MLAVALLILGGALVAAGVGVLAGPGWALVAAGIGCMALGVDLAREPRDIERKSFPADVTPPLPAGLHVPPPANPGPADEDAA